MIAGREVECGVLGNADPVVSVAGEIVLERGSEWYDFSAKYDEGGMSLIAPADIDPAAAERSCAMPPAAHSRSASAPGWRGSTSSSLLTTALS